MKKVIFAIMSMMVISISASAAVPVLGPMIFGVAAGGTGYLAGSRDASGQPGACYNEPVRLVKWKSAPGYSFEVAGCDYQAKKDNLIVIK